MTPELWALFGYGLILFLSIMIQAVHLDLTAGLGFTASNRDTSVDAARSIVAGRLERTVRNQVEGLALFAPFVIVATATDISNEWTQGAALATIIARALYLPAYAFGTGWVRSVVWMGAFLAIPAFAYGILLETGLPF